MHFSETQLGIDIFQCYLMSLHLQLTTGKMNHWTRIDCKLKLARMVFGDIGLNAL